MEENMSKKILFLGAVLLICFSFNTDFLEGQQVEKARTQQLKVAKRPILAYRFEIQGIKRIFTSPTRVKFQVQYYISPTYPKPCFISAYIPNKASQSPKFAYNPAGRLPDGVPKGQKHFTDNVTFEVHYTGSGSYTSSTIEVVIYNQVKNLKTQILNWGQTWGSPAPSPPDLIISSIQVSKYNPYVKTTFTVNVKNTGGTAAGQADISVWLYKLLPNGSEPSTPNEYWSGKVPAAGGTIAPSAIVPWTHDKYEFMTDGNWRVRAKINPFSTVTESNYTNNSYTYNFPIPN
jgi:hypothetical protein